MNLLSSFLSRFSSLQSPELLVRNSANIFITETIGTTIPSHNILYQNNRIVIQGSTSLKHAIAMRKLDFIAHLKQTLPDSIVVKDIV